MKTVLLDCTLRDGGYYTNWDFETKVVDAYIQAMNALPIDYLEFTSFVTVCTINPLVR